MSGATEVEPGARAVEWATAQAWNGWDGIAAPEECDEEVAERTHSNYEAGTSRASSPGKLSRFASSGLDASLSKRLHLQVLRERSTLVGDYARQHVHHPVMLHLG